MHRFSHITTAVFVLIICLPILGLTGVFGSGERLDNKAKQKLPAISKINVSNSWKYTKQYESYYAENFPLRSTLLKSYLGFMTNTLSTNPLEQVVIGKDGWLFLGNGSNKTLNDHLNLRPFSQKEEKEIESNIKDNANYLASKGIKYYVVIAPNKHSIYGEHLPDQLIKAGEISRLDRTASIISPLEGVTFIDLRQPLLKSKDNKLLYYKSDTHWNQLGALLGFKEILNKIRRDFPQISTMSTSENPTSMENRTGGDLANMLGDRIKYEEEAPSPKILAPDSITPLVTTTEVPKKFNRGAKKYHMAFSNPIKPLKVMIHRDSFTGALMPYFQQTFGESHFVFQWHLRKDLIEQENPNIVIQIVVERHLDTFTNDGKPFH